MYLVIIKTMRSLFATFTIFGKFALLGCFSLFGGYCGTVEAATVPPCHQTAIKEAADMQTAPCGYCEHSEETWSEPIASPFVSEKEIPTIFVIPSLIFQEEFVIRELVIEPLIIPPEDLFVRTIKQIARSTEWRSSAC